MSPRRTIRPKTPFARPASGGFAAALLLSLLGATAAAAQPALRPPADFFPRADLMKIGVYYYPEQWPRAQWERDLKAIAALGFEFTHFAEFAWALLEPSEGKFDFAWLDAAVDLAAKAGLKVVLCTPTPCPPAWMGEKYPEIYLVGADGRRRQHGIRSEASLADRRYREGAERITAALARRYGRDKRIWGWQLDNEPPAAPDYSPAARLAFQDWLRRRYGTIEGLNASWVGSFWSTRFDRFEQVLIPNASLAGEDKLSPHALLDFQRFTADLAAEFLDRQADILRGEILPEQWITTNYVNASLSADPRRTTRLDFPCFTMYPVNGTNVLGGPSFRLGNPFRIAEACDYYRPIRGVTGIMELQPGQINWAATNPQPLPGAIHMWILHAFGGRSSFLCTYRYRHPLGSSEMYHDGIVGTDGVTLSRGGEEFVRAIGDIKRLRAEYDPKAGLPAAPARRRTAFLWSHDAMWDLDIQPQSASWNTWRHRNIYAAAVKSTGAPLDFISEADDFSRYPFLVAPAYGLVSPALVKKWRTYVEGGGHLVLSCRSGQKDENGHFFEAKLGAALADLTGADLEFFDMLLPGGTAAVKAGGRTYPWSVWGEILAPRAGTDIRAVYADQFYAGKAAAVSRTVGRGTVTYIGVETVDGALERELVRSVYARAGAAIEDLPKGVYVEWRDGFTVGVNYSNVPVFLRVPPGGRILVGANPLASGQAIVWK